jgi:cytochrome c biogenesis protein CcdA
MSELILSLAAGALSTLNPCVFPLLPLVAGGAMQVNRLAPVAMGVGMAVSFALLGVLVGLLGDALNFDAGMTRQVGGALLLAIGASMLLPAANERISRWMTPLASNAQAVSDRINQNSLSGAFALGCVLGFVWAPCSGPLLLSAITLVASEGGTLRGALLLGLFGAGAAVPLVAVAYASRQGFMRSRGWMVQHGAHIKTAFAGLLILMGAMILSGLDKQLESLLVALLPDFWIELTTRF